MIRKIKKYLKTINFNVTIEQIPVILNSSALNITRGYKLNTNAITLQ